MPKLTLQELRKIREKESKRLQKREIHGKNCHIVVEMGTVGLVAGAKAVLNQFVDDIEKYDLKNVIVTQVGQAHDSLDAPVVEVYTPETGSVAYGKVTAKLATKIIKEHVIDGKILEDLRIKLED